MNEMARSGKERDYLAGADALDESWKRRVSGDEKKGTIADPSDCGMAWLLAVEDSVRGGRFSRERFGRLNTQRRDDRRDTV